MRIPSLKIILPLIALAWCVAGVMVHGAIIIFYPLVWMTVLSGFLMLNAIFHTRQLQRAEKRSSDDPPASKSPPHDRDLEAVAK